MRRLWLKLTNLLRPKRAEAELSREVAAHLAVLEDAFRRRGMAPDDARFAARRAFGGVEQAKELHRNERSFGWVDDLQRDIRYALRGLRRSPGFTAVAVLTVAVGIGGTTAVFSVVNGIVLKPLPYPDADALVGLWHLAPGANIGGDVNLSAGQFLTYREETRTLQEIGLWSSELGTVTGVGEPEEVRRLTVAYGTLQALGVAPAVGRWFSESDDTVASPPTVMLAYDYWQRRFGGDNAVIGAL